MTANPNRNYPPDAQNVWGCSAVVTTTTAVAVITNTATGERLYITQIVVTNKTAAELPVILIADTAGTPNDIIYLAPGDLSVTHSSSTLIWTPPDPVKLGATALGITAEATTATGDCHVFAQGFLVSE